ncbi:MAG: succinyl-diaminopimelate desuccinylase [Rhodospirillaceae bacterium]|jgi:succinyl-diaminopimelate desuccinylase|nr:succinyl-diaminopimelate desuccinylase [Rhodospirillaceae bacterium]MBT5566032.1 succinyl-diaminopimelate desuccinylase [Rhodospirillaceae bacterium]MBT6089014.1 succinyl-diaminopimelate desuccinylase [Rhodospirillaceae bacterium]MBT6960411.1 succinyl-diaminopimelate desuccinylase [Rhodospirillaceae bacterium]MBT7450725.1 succinyl-diaminopimelate desuccinylase [Rhodospirillaceae bacterium]
MTGPAAPSAVAALVDPLPLARDLIRCPSVTPEDAGALDVLATALESLGFECHRLQFDEPDTALVHNLYARLGDSGPNFCFAGHTDVVPVGTGWTVDPFAADVIDDHLYGRGAADMKGAIACFTAAVAESLEASGRPNGSISLLITGDEEGPAINGTKKVLEWLKDRGEVLDVCLVGEPTNPTRLGEMIKIGRRGSLNGKITVYGTQGHVAYPHLADNPVSALLRLLTALTANPLDSGTETFQPSTLTLTSVDVGNEATNVIPAEARAAFNIRFNDDHSGESLTTWLNETLAEAANGADFAIDVQISGESFVTPPGPLSEIVSQAITEVTSQTPELSTSGGTSDARFIRSACPVCEFGLVGQTMHKADERVSVSDLENLTKIYRHILDRFFTT